MNVAGMAVFGAMFTGMMALLFAPVAAMSRQPMGGAVCLLAASVAFGAVANALRR